MTGRVIIFGESLLTTIPVEAKFITKVSLFSHVRSLPPWFTLGHSNLLEKIKKLNFEQAVIK